MSAIFAAFALQYVFGVISPKIKIKNVIIPIVIANPPLSNIFNAISVAKAVEATLTRLFPRFTLAIILLGLDFSL